MVFFLDNNDEWYFNIWIMCVKKNLFVSDGFPEIRYD